MDTMRHNRTATLVLTALVLAAAAAPVATPAANVGTSPEARAEGVLDAGDGTYVIGEAITANAGVIGAAVDTACTDTTYAVKPWRVIGTLTWYYNGGAAAPAVAGTALSAITSASNTVAKGVNRCGRPTTFATVHKYGGATAAAAQVGSDTRCTGNDGRSVTSWGALPATVLAYTCTYFTSKGVVLASDTLIDNRAHTWFTTLPAGCSGAYDLETTMAHERLHTAGLAHVNQTRNAAQTMTPASAPCDTSRRTLGAGDHAGLSALAALR
jgi:hypothetical protein